MTDEQHHPNPAITVVIPTHNRSALVREAIESLWQQTLPSNLWEIVVVDNCSTDDTPQVIAELILRSPCRMSIVKTDRDRGPAGARNAGAAKAKGAFIAFVDSDVFLHPSWLQHALETMKADESIGILSGKLVYASRPDRINAYGGEMGRLGHCWDGYEGSSVDEVTQAVNRLWAPTAAVLTRKNLFDELGGFDDTYYFSYEDSDYGWRVNLAGLHCVCMPHLVAHHRVNERKEAAGPVIMFHAYKNRFRSMIKNLHWTRLPVRLTAYALYSLVDMILRSPRIPKIKALCWNLYRFPDTLRQRSRIQRSRRCKERDIERLYSRQLFPGQTIRARHQQQSDLNRSSQTTGARV